MHRKQFNRAGRFGVKGMHWVAGEVREGEQRRSDGLLSELRVRRLGTCIPNTWSKVLYLASPRIENRRHAGRI